MDEHRFHYIVFNKDSTCDLFIPYQNHGEAMLGGRQTHYILKYVRASGSLNIIGVDSLVGQSPVYDRLTNAKFTIVKNHEFQDVSQDLYYFSRKKQNEPARYIMFVIDNRFYKWKLPKFDGHSLVKRSYNNKKFFRIVKPDDFAKLDTLNGIEAYKKYGKRGVNGIIVLPSDE